MLPLASSAPVSFCCSLLVIRTDLNACLHHERQQSGGQFAPAQERCDLEHREIETSWVEATRRTPGLPSVEFGRQTIGLLGRRRGVRGSRFSEERRGAAA